MKSAKHRAAPLLALRRVRSAVVVVAGAAGLLLAQTAAPVNGSTTAALLRAAQQKLSAHQPAAALALLEQARRGAPQAVQPLLAEGAVYQSMALPVRAEGVFRQALARQPASQLGWQGLLQAQIDQTRWQDALQTDQQALARWPHHRDFLYQQALLLINLGRAAEAAGDLHTIEARWPGFAAAHYSAAVVADSQGREAVALLELQTTRGLAGDNGQIAFLEGIVEQHLHHDAQARAAFQRAIRFHPGDPAIHRLLAQVLVRLHQPAAARAELAEAGRLAAAAKERETRQARLSQLDQAAEQRALGNDLAGSLALYDQALQLAPKDVNALAGKGKVLYSMRNFQAAVLCFRQATAQAPASDDLHFLYGLALARLSDAAGARRELQSALALNPANRDARALLASLPRS